MIKIIDGMEAGCIGPVMGQVQTILRKVYVGDQRVLLVCSWDNDLLAVVADQRTAALERFARLRRPACLAQCWALRRELHVGYVLADAEWCHGMLNAHEAHRYGLALRLRSALIGGLAHV